MNKNQQENLKLLIFWNCDTNQCLNFHNSFFETDLKNQLYSLINCIIGEE